MTDGLMTVSVEILEGNGEDSFALRTMERGAFLCVADGCGGLGSCRYPALDNHTGAYAASRLAAHAALSWVNEKEAPLTQAMGETMGRELGLALDRLLSATAEEKCRMEGVRIVGTMQRRLPTTLCAALVDEQAAGFFWTGDSRGYVLDRQGLHQCTKDDLRGETDPFENLYLDRPLSACLSADTQAKIHFRRVPVSAPALIITATDGAFSALATPMEFEMLLLDALKASKSWEGFEGKLAGSIKKNAQDDATLLAAPFGMSDFDEAKAALLPRRETLQKQFITPVRRKKGDLSFARERWQQYRPGYDWTEESCDG